MVTTGDPHETTRWSPGTSQRYRGHRGSGRCALALRPAAGKSLESPDGNSCGRWESDGIWKFAESWGYLQLFLVIIHFRWGFSILNQPFWISPHIFRTQKTHRNTQRKRITKETVRTNIGNTFEQFFPFHGF